MCAHARVRACVRMGVGVCVGEWVRACAKECQCVVRKGERDNDDESEREIMMMMMMMRERERERERERDTPLRAREREREREVWWGKQMEEKVGNQGRLSRPKL